MEEGSVLNNRYQLLERIGSGGMADVFRARDLMLERSVAIKILHEKYTYRLRENLGTGPRVYYIPAEEVKPEA